MSMIAKRSSLLLRVAACLVLVATAAAFTATTAAAQAYCANPLYLDINGEDVDSCGTEEAPCASLSYVAERALSCSTELGEEITILQLAEDGEIAVGLASASGLADAPAVTGIGTADEAATSEEATSEEAPEAEAAAEDESAAEAAADAEAEPAAHGEEMGEEAGEESGGWLASRDDALYSILALVLGAVLGVIIGYGSRSGAAATAALLLGAVLALSPAAAQAQIQCPGEYSFFSAETGEDVDACGDAEQPCATFEAALTQASACLHGVTIYEGETPIFTLELSSSLTDVGDDTISEIGESAVNVEVADEVDTGGAVEESAEEVAAEVVESVEDASDVAEELADVTDEPVAGDLDWVWLIGMIALGTVLGYAAHALPSAKIE